MPFLVFRRDHLRSTSGIICGSGSFAVQFGNHFRSGDHLRSGIICSAVQYGIFHKISSCTCQTLSVGCLDKVLRAATECSAIEPMLEANFCRHVSSLSPLFSLEFDLSEKREKLDLSCYQSDCYTILQRNTCDLNACQCLSIDSAIFSNLALRPRFHATSGNGLNLCIFVIES